MSITVSAIVVVGLVLAYLVVARLTRGGGARLQWALSLAALAVALWTAWSVYQDHAVPESTTEAAAAFR